MTTTAAATLPLTTVFSPPTSCFSTVTRQAGHASVHALVLGYGSNCVPSGAGTSERTYAFSPGLDCPSSYTTVLSTWEKIGTVTESRAICCPVLDGIAPLSGLAFSYNTENGNRLPFYSTLGCTANFVRDYTLALLDGETTMVSQFKFGGGGGINAYSVQIAWQSSDLHSVSATLTPTSLPFTPTKPTSSMVSTPSSTLMTSSLPTTITTPGTSSLPTTSSVSNSDLSVSAKVAMGISVPLGALTLILIAILFAKRRGQVRSPNDSRHLYDQRKSLKYGPGLYIGELDAPKYVGELDATKYIRELDTTNR